MTATMSTKLLDISYRMTKMNSKENKPVKNEKKCPYAKQCGGCAYIGEEYSSYLAKKKEYVEKLLAPFVKVSRITGMEEPFFYRNKVTCSFGIDAKKHPVSGIYAANSHRIVDVKECLIEDKRAREVLNCVRELVKAFKIRVFDEDTGYGLLRHVMVRVGKTSGQIMVVLVTASPVFPSKQNFCRELLKKCPDITTIVQNVNIRTDSLVLSDKENVFYGKGYIEDELCGKIFRISSRSFYQVNSVQTKNLYSKAIEFAGLSGKEVVFDAYSGIGTIGICASDFAKRVISVELNKDAVKDAVFNAKRNEVKNISFYTDDAGKFMVKMARDKEKADVVFMDPPRTGSSKEFIDSVFSLSPSKVVYISCNPETLARDLKMFKAGGYVAREAESFDMFPFTNHVESVVLLSKVKE